MKLVKEEKETPPNLWHLPWRVPVDCLLRRHTQIPWEC